MLDMVYQWARKIHRWFMFVTIFLGAIMSITGQVMEGNLKIFTDA
ncbi:MAG: hypothetical protein NZL96_02300 [Patescibacteria group bacterium]|nr:hypothetical protein [Patescibacteria group bacterium]